MKSELLDILQSGLDAVETGPALTKHLPQAPLRGRCFVIGAGKASAAMAAALETAWSQTQLSGVVATRYGHAVPTRNIQIIEAGHPVPDENSLKAGDLILELLSTVTPEDTVLALISGGGSACLEAPIDGLSLHDLSGVTDQLLASGAPISEINFIRKSLSQIKGGKLLSHIAPARLINFVISDIPGDELSDVASGPTIMQPASKYNLHDLLDGLGIDPPSDVEIAPRSTNVPALPEGWQPETYLIASAATALSAMEKHAQHMGYRVINLGDDIEIDCRKFAAEQAHIVNQIIRSRPDTPVAIISGGELGARILSDNPGKGGRNTEFLLALLRNLEAETSISAAAIDSDGFDGSAGAAGALFTPQIRASMKASDSDTDEYLKRQDSASFFERFGACIHTGATFTNVNDLRVILIPAET